MPPLDARAAFDVWRGAPQMYLHAAAYCLVSALLEQDELDEAAAALALGDREPPAVGVLRRLAAHGARARSPPGAATTPAPGGVPRRPAAA